MSEIALVFLERWTIENVSAVPDDRLDAEAERLAAACAEDAAKEGITEEELGEASSDASEGDDLIAYMAKAIEKVALEELDELEDEDEADA
jgi:hypothetical protein